jgi:hypothetical protein
LTHQRDGLPPPDDWVNTDVAELDLVRMLGPRTIVARPLGDLDRLDSLADHRVLRWLVRWLLRHLGHVSWLAHRLGGSSWDTRMVLDWRNTVAATAALDVPAGTPVIATWGSAHLPGIGTLLARNDFTLEQVHWFTAIAPRRWWRRRGGAPAAGPVSTLG